MRIDRGATRPARVIALPAPRAGAHSADNKTWLALLWLTLPAVVAGFGKAQDMSWLGGNWYGVLAIFGIPVLLGILCWAGVHFAIATRARHERARQARRRLPGSRASHRPF